MNLWAAKWISENELDGRTEHIMNENLMPKLFKTRWEARAWIKETHGYIAERPDLCREPHGWKMPRAVRVEIVER